MTFRERTRKLFVEKDFLSLDEKYDRCGMIFFCFETSLAGTRLPANAAADAMNDVKPLLLWLQLLLLLMQTSLYALSPVSCPRLGYLGVCGTLLTHVNHTSWSRLPSMPCPLSPLPCPLSQIRVSGHMWHPLDPCHCGRCCCYYCCCCCWCCGWRCWWYETLNAGMSVRCNIAGQGNQLRNISIMFGCLDTANCSSRKPWGTVLTIFL